MTDGAEIIAGCFRIRPEQRGPMKVCVCIHWATCALVGSRCHCSDSSALRKAGTMPHRRRQRASGACGQEQGLPVRVSVVCIRSVLCLRSYRHSRYAWGVMAWQPSAWPLLNDQDPHTGYMMQVRSVSAARRRVGVTLVCRRRSRPVAALIASCLSLVTTTAALAVSTCNLRRSCGTRLKAASNVLAFHLRIVIGQSIVASVRP